MEAKKEKTVIRVGEDGTQYEELVTTTWELTIAACVAAIMRLFAVFFVISLMVSIINMATNREIIGPNTRMLFGGILAGYDQIAELLVSIWQKIF